VQASSDTLTNADRTQLQAEVSQLIAEINRIADTTEFNTQKLLNGTFTSKTIQIGANAAQTLTLDINNMNATALGVNTVNISTQDGASAAITTIDTAINNVSSEHATLGANQNRLEYTIANLGAAAENLTAAESRIRDVDMAIEMANFTKHQILLQSGAAMQAQANAKPQAVLQLLR